METTRLIHNATIITPLTTYDDGWLLYRDGRIVGVGGGVVPDIPGIQRIDAQKLTLLPGFVDIHVHGGDGADTMDATPEALTTMARFFARHGVTTFLATTWTDTRERITAALEAIAACTGPIEHGATMLGAHIEGPYLNAGMAGAQNTDYVRHADREEAMTFLDFGVTHLMALAPEFPENHWLIEECVRRGITVSIAHTDADYDMTMRAIDLGVSHATHTFNAMIGLHHRTPGTVGAVIRSNAVRCELIADTIHVHPAVIDILWRLKGPDRLVLVSDSMRAAGQPDGDYRVDDRTIYVRDGVARLEAGNLAGSTLTLNIALRNLMQATGEPLERCWRASSLNAAQAINMAHERGSIEAGKLADLVLVDNNLDVYLTITEGRVAYSNSERFPSI